MRQQRRSLSTFIGGTDDSVTQENLSAGKNAQEILRTTGANVLIWGSVTGSLSSPVLALRITAPENTTPGRYPLTAQQSLPDTFWSDVSGVLRMCVLQQYAEFESRRGKFVAQSLAPFVVRVEHLTKSDAFGKLKPPDRARIEFSLGNVRALIAGETSDVAMYRKAVDAYQAALSDVAAGSIESARIDMSIAGTLAMVSLRTGDTHDRDVAEKAVRDSLQVITKGNPTWPAAMGNLAIVLVLAHTPGSLQEAVAIDEEIMGVYREAGAPRRDFFLPETNASSAYEMMCGQNGEGSCERAVYFAKAAIEDSADSGAVIDIAREKGTLASAEIQLADVLFRTGKRSAAEVFLGDIIGLYDAAENVLTADAAPRDFAMLEKDRGYALLVFGRAKHDVTYLERALSSEGEALRILDEKTAPYPWAVAQAYRGDLLLELATAHYASFRDGGGVDGEGILERAALEEVSDAYHKALRVLTEANAPGLTRHIQLEVEPVDQYLALPTSNGPGGGR